MASGLHWTLSTLEGEVFVLFGTDTPTLDMGLSLLPEVLLPAPLSEGLGTADLLTWDHVCLRPGSHFMAKKL